jgi:rod shape-determining protein MreD
MTPRTKGRLRVAVLLVVAIVLQTSVGSDLRIERVAPDFMLLLAICAGLFGGARQGMLVGFACGLLSDIWLTNTPLGLSALTFCLLGYCVGALRATLVPEGWLLVPVLAFVATAVGVIGFVVIGDVVGQSQLLVGGRSVLVRTVVIESLANTVFSLPVAWLYQRCSGGTEGVAEIERGSAERMVR